MKKEHSQEECTIIRMMVKNDDDFLSVFSAGETPVISTDVAEFIESNTISLPPSAPLKLHIHSNCIDEKEKIEYSKAIREYYAERYRANEQERKHNRRVVLLLALVGVLILSLALFLDGNNHFLWGEVIDIAAWVFLWEAVDIGAFRNRVLRINRLRYRSYMMMKIEYYPLKEQ
ncbi:MAG: hypothetical protein IJY20_02810 [Clostridia bacterium]|nr:hypothetical protein [Clostridia bacterium]